MSFYDTSLNAYRQIRIYEDVLEVKIKALSQTQRKTLLLSFERLKDHCTSLHSPKFKENLNRIFLRMSSAKNHTKSCCLVRLIKGILNRLGWRVTSKEVLKSYDALASDILFQDFAVYKKQHFVKGKKLKFTDFLDFHGMSYNCNGVNFSKSLLINIALLHEVEFSDIIFSYCSFKLNTLSDVLFKRCRFDHCDLTNTYIKNSEIENSEFEECETKGIKLENCEITDSKFTVDDTIEKELQKVKLKNVHYNLKKLNN